MNEKYLKFSESAVPVFNYHKVFKYNVLLTHEDLESVFNNYKQLKGSVPYIAFDTETDGLNPSKSRICGYSFSLDGVNGYYVPLRHKSDINAPKSTLDYIANLMKEGKSIFIMFNKKFDLNMMDVAEGYDIGTGKNIHDAQILTFLRDSDVPFGGGLKNAAQHYLGIQAPKYADVTGGASFDFASVEDIKEYACVHEETYISVVRGFNKVNILIKDIKPGDLVISSKGTLYPILNKQQTGTKELVTLTFDNGTTLKLTPDHLCLVYGENNSYEWVEARDLLNREIVEDLNEEVEEFLLLNDKIYRYSHLHKGE